MDIIIRILVNLFKELFEQDSKRREAERLRRQKILAQWQAQQRAAQQKAALQRAQAPSPQGGGASRQTAGSNLAMQIEALFQDMDQQARERERVPAPPPPPPPEHREVVRKPKVVPARKETRAKGGVGKVRTPKPKSPRGGKGRRRKSPLRQMILAKVMLDPPKAIRDDLL